MASIFHSVYESNDSTFSSRNFYADYPSLENIEIEPCHFKPTQLSESLAIISNLCYEGFDNIEDVPEVLTKLRNTIMELMIYCIRIERSAYHEYIQTLARKTNLFMERIVVEVLKACHEPENATSCFFLVKAIHDVVLLIYSFTNPLKIPDSLTENSAMSEEAHMTSFKIEDILEATKNLHGFILCFPLLNERDARSVEASSVSASASLVNNTPKQLFKDEAADILNYLAKINLVVINNCVPTVGLFTYFESILQSDEFSLLELEYFEEFLSHFARIDKFCKSQKAASYISRLTYFDRQKRELRTPFFQMLQRNPFRKLNWCTSLQAVNYLQIFVDLYNEIYEEGLILERWLSNETGQESTVVRKIVDDRVAKTCDCAQDHPQPITPDFVNFFANSPPQDTESNPDLGGIGRSENEVEFGVESVSQDNKGQLCSRLPNIRSPPRKIFQLNEDVAYEIRDIRSLMEEKYRTNKVTFKEQKCFKCKYLPWHKHSNP